MAWESELEQFPDHVRAIGMISIENGNLELALADLMATALMRRLRIFGQRDKLKADRSKGA